MGQRAGASARPDEALSAASGRRWFTYLQKPWGFTVDRWLVRLTGWSMLSSISSRLGGRPYTKVLLITTIGARSGELRSKVLPYVPLDGSYVLVGSNFGGPTDPAWTNNVRADGSCWIRVQRRSMAARAAVASGEEREMLLPRVIAAKPNVATYVDQAARYGRELPLVVVRPIATS